MYAKAILLLTAVCFSVTQADDVLEFGDADFKGKISGLDVALVEFFAPWCGHCKRLAPEYETAATALKKNDPPIPLIKVDCTEAGKETCGKYGVSGYPTLKIFKGGEMASDYNGPRDANGIISFMKKEAGPSSVEIADKEKMDKVLANEDHTIIGFFEDSSSDWAKSFMKTADGKRNDYRFAHTYNADLTKEHGEKDGIYLFRAKRLSSKFEEQKVKYDGENSRNGIESWIAKHFHGLCGHRTASNQAQFEEPLVVAYYGVDYVRNPKGTNYWRNRVMKAGGSFAEKGYTLAISDSSEFAQELSEFGAGDEKSEKPRVAARKNGKKYLMQAEFSMDNLKAWLEELDEDKLEPYLKSEPVPSSQGNVKVVVAKNFDEIVNDPDRDVLVEFYAPWCGHCKSLEPKFNELGDKLANEDGITIAKMDATANDVPPPYQVQGFPTLYFAPKGNKSSPKKYEGGREVKDFIKYLAKESTDGLQNYDSNGKKRKDKKKEL